MTSGRGRPPKRRRLRSRVVWHLAAYRALGRLGEAELIDALVRSPREFVATLPLLPRRARSRALAVLTFAVDVAGRGVVALAMLAGER